MKEITVTIMDGKATVATKGFTGKACYDATAELERAMGMRTEDRKTPEYDFKHVQSHGA
jgi:hypothetical protein